MIDYRDAQKDEELVDGVDFTSFSRLQRCTEE